MGHTTRLRDHYAALHVSPDATEAEIIKAAKKRRIETHPDKFAGKSLTQEEIDKINYRAQCVGLAADILCDPTARKEYDLERAQWHKSHKSAEQPAKESSSTRRRSASVKMSDIFNQFRKGSAAQADEAPHAPRPSASARPRADTFREDRHAPRQDRDAPRQDRDTSREDRYAPPQDTDTPREDPRVPRLARDAHPQRRDSTRQEPRDARRAPTQNSGQASRHIIGSLYVKGLERAPRSDRKSSRHGVERKVRFEQNVRFAPSTKMEDGDQRYPPLN